MTDFPKLMQMLETQNTKTLEDAKHALNIQIHSPQGTGIRPLVEYYTYQRSERALTLLCSIKSPNHKLLLEALNDGFRKSIHSTIILLGQIIQSHPFWVADISQAQIFYTILNTMCNPNPKPPVPHKLTVIDEISVLLFMSNLLPWCAHNIRDGDTMMMLFKLFLVSADSLRIRIRSDKVHADAAVRAASSRSNPSSTNSDVEAVHSSHLHFAVREYFFTLYGIFPNMLVTYLRSILDPKDVERIKTYRAVIRPLLSVVRLHPNIIELSDRNEMKKERWYGREANDVLDECRRMVIGVIPVSAAIGEEEDLPNGGDGESTEISDVYHQLYPAQDLGTTSSADFWREDSSHDQGDVEAGMTLMGRLDTPPGTPGGTPMQKNSFDVTYVGSSHHEGKRRRSTGASESETGKKSFRQKISSLITRSSGRLEPADPLPEVEIVGAEEEGPRRNSEQLEEAEEVVDDITRDERRRKPTMLIGEEHETPSTSSTMKVNDAEEARAAARRSLRGRERAESLLRGSTTSHGATIDDDDDRSRSTSFLTTARSDDEEDVRSRGGLSDILNLSDGGNGGAGGSNASVRPPFVLPTTPTQQHAYQHYGPTATTPTSSDAGGEGRGLAHFSLKGYFIRENRNRFHSECPPKADLVVSPRLVGDEIDGTALGGSVATTHTLKRTYSAPVIMEDVEDAADARADSIRTVQDSAMPTRLDIMKMFPYLMLIREHTESFVRDLEGELERDHDVARERYMETSERFHAKLKELNLADRLPGKIYDDMTHILKDLPTEKQQKEVLLTRLQLVNQHLLYERSVRLLHANRNRKLFARIKQQKEMDVQKANLNKAYYDVVNEKRELTISLTDMRRSEQKLTAEFAAKEVQWRKIIEDQAKKEIALEFNCNLAEEQARSIALNAEHLQRTMDTYKRAAEDATNQITIMEEQLKNAFNDAEAARMHYNLAQERIGELERDRRGSMESNGGGTSPVWMGPGTSSFGDSTRLAQLEGELERVRVERENQRRELEELRERLSDAHSQVDREQQRAQELRSRLDRSARLLDEQSFAAEQKFLSLQAVSQRQEETILQLYLKNEELENCEPERNFPGDPTRRITIPRSAAATRLQSEIRSYESSHGSEVTSSLLVGGGEGREPERTDRKRRASSSQDDDAVRVVDL